MLEFSKYIMAMISPINIYSYQKQTKQQFTGNKLTVKYALEKFYKVALKLCCPVTAAFLDPKTCSFFFCQITLTA